MERAYLFLDNCTDGSEAVARKFPWIEVIDRPKPPETQFMRQHQNACAGIALEMAREEGFEWLLHLDADELAFGGEPLQVDPDTKSPSLLARLSGRDFKAAIARADLCSMLADLKPDTAMVHLPTHEGFPMKIDRTEDFWQNPYFQSGEPFVQRILDPISGQNKSSTATSVTIKGSRSFARRPMCKRSTPTAGRPRRVLNRPSFLRMSPSQLRTFGCHFHYLIVNTVQWIKKYAQFNGLAMNWPSGVPLSFPKGSWRKAALEMSEREAADYLKEWLFRTPTKLDELVRAGDILKESDAATILKKVLS